MSEFERYAPAIALFFGGCAVVPMIFAVVVALGGSPVTPELYGPVVHAIPAAAWIVAQFALAGAAATGAALRWPRVAAAGALGVAALMAFFAAAALLAGPAGTLLVAGAGGWLAPVSLISAWVAWYGR